MKTIWVISCITALVACSSDPMGHVKAPKDPAEDDEASSAMPDHDEPPLVGEEVDASLPRKGEDAGAQDEADAAAPPDASPPPKSDAPAPTGPACAPGDAIEIEGTDTPTKGAGCGELASAGDEDFFLVAVPVAKTLTLRLAATGDAVARLSTPNDNLASVGAGGSATIGSTSGTALVRLRSRSGTVQKYRFLVE